MTWTIHTGDCLSILPTLPSGSVDAVVTDPPYGCGFTYSSYDDTKENWRALMDGAVPQMRRVSRFVVMPACDRMAMAWWYSAHAPDWMIAWYKGSPGHRSPIGFNDWEPLLCWGRPSIPMHDHFQSPCGFDKNGHPCPKPIEWAMWLVQRAASMGDTVLDPFCGSGTTGVACILTGRNFIGIEICEEYAEIARRRCREAEESQALFVPARREEQPSLGFGVAS